jgi:short subunit dehydrogenase-like uncharacterized protein
MNQDIWVLGATGRSGRGIAARLHASGHRVVLAGRDPQRLADVAAILGDAAVVSGSFDELLNQARAAAPAVIVNTVGPFARTAARVLDACPPGTHYVDIGNELAATRAVLDRHGQAVANGSTFVTSAGFGVLATEAAAVRVCADRPRPASIRVDAVPSLATTGGVIGEALAGSMLEGAPDGGRRVARGALVRAAVAGSPLKLTTPDGDAVTTVSLPTGDLLAAWRTSNADSVVSATAAIPSNPAIRVVFPVLSLVLRSAALRRRAISRLARVALPEKERPRGSSWGHARAEWADGTSRQVWLRIGDAQDFTEAAAAEVARRLLRGAQPGAHTPAALYGASLATDLGATFSDDDFVNDEVDDDAR